LGKKLEKEELVEVSTADVDVLENEVEVADRDV